MLTPTKQTRAEQTAEAIDVGLREGMRIRDQQVAEATASATVEALRKAGWLRETPATRALVRHVVRDASGLIVSTFERMEQLEEVK